MIARITWVEKLYSGFRLADADRCGGKDSAPRSQISREISGNLLPHGLANSYGHADFLGNFRKPFFLDARRFPKEFPEILV